MKVKYLENYLLWTYVLKWRSTLQHNLIICKYLGQVQNTSPPKNVIFAKEIKRKNKPCRLNILISFYGFEIRTKISRSEWH